MSTALPKVALLGRPNVGKSTLFNRIVGKRQSITAAQAGTTRDRIEGAVRWKDREFLLVDMAGLELELGEHAELDRAAQQQVRIGLETADVIVWVVEGTEDPQAVDYEIAKLLRSTRKPVIIAANKCDHANHDVAAQEYASFGFMPLVTLSAIHGRGVGELLEEVTRKLPALHSEPEAEKNRQIRISIVGRPNVGKSTLINTLMEQERTVVSDVAGTTRDSVEVAIDSNFKYYFPGWDSVWLIDTAGVRRRGRVEKGIEQWSVIRTYEAIDNSDVVLCLLDATEGLVHQDLQVLQHVMESGRAVVLVVNKWDLAIKGKVVHRGSEHDNALQAEFLDDMLRTAPFLYWCPVVFTSALDGHNVKIIGELVSSVFASWIRIPTKEELAPVTERLQHNPRFKNLLEITCAHAAPPVFHLITEGKKIPHFSSIRHAENVLREELGLGPTPIKVWIDPTVSTRSERA